MNNFWTSKSSKKKCWTWKFFLISLYSLADLKVTYNSYFGPTVNSFPIISAQTRYVAKTQHRVLTGGTKPCTNGLTNFEKPLFWGKFFHLIFLFQTGPDFKIPKKIWIILELQKVPKNNVELGKKKFFYIFFLISLYFLADLRVTYNGYFGPTVNSFPTISAQTPCVAKTQHRVLTG